MVWCVCVCVCVSSQWTWLYVIYIYIYSIYIYVCVNVKLLIEVGLSSVRISNSVFGFGFQFHSQIHVTLFSLELDARTLFYVVTILQSDIHHRRVYHLIIIVFLTSNEVNQRYCNASTICCVLNYGLQGIIGEHRFFFCSFSLLLLRVKGRGCHTLLKPHETNCGLWIWAIQIKFDWLIDISMSYYQ